MKNLSEKEFDEVAGGLAPAFGVAVAGVMGAASSGLSEYSSGGTWKGVATAALVGGVAGVAGGMATITTGFVSLGWGIRSVFLFGSLGAEEC